MKVKELKKLIEQYEKTDPNKDTLEKEIVIQIEPKKGVIHGSTPHAEVKSAHFGFDWDHNYLILQPKNKLKGK